MDTPPPHTHTICWILTKNNYKFLCFWYYIISSQMYLRWGGGGGWRWIPPPPSPQRLIHCPQYMTLTFPCYVHVLSSDLDCSQINKPSLFVLRKMTKVKLLGRDTQLKKSHLCYWEPEIVDGMYTYAWYITIYDYSIMDHLMLQCEGCTIIGKEHYTCISVFW